MTKHPEDIVEEAIEGTAEGPVEGTAEEPIEDTAEEPIEDTAEEPIEDTAEEAADESTEETAAETVDETDGEATDEALDETDGASAEEAASQSAEAAADAGEPSYRPSKLKPFHIAGIVLAAILLVAGTAYGFAIPARPSESLVEKRTLAEFPEFDIDSLLSGKYFSEIELWYTDTYPLREDLVGMSQAIEAHYGITPEVGFTGGDVVADTLPTEEEIKSEEPPTPKTYAFEPVPMPDGSTWGAEITEALLRGLYTEDGICYGLFYFNQSSADRYTAAINLTAELLEGECDVYALLAPMNSALYLDDELVESLGGSNQRDALAYYYRQFAPNVHIVQVYDSLKEHADEYLYFGTDHHWTMRGAYYAYLDLCDAMGIEPVDALNDWEYISYTPFQGSYATGLGDTELTADTVEAWIPEDTNDQVYWDWDGTLEPKGKFYIINDLNEEAKSTGHYANMYQHDDAAGFSTFGGGDWGLVRVDNPNIHDDSTLLIVKDSYADALYPLMVPHYEHVYVMDFRYFDYNIPQFAREYGVDDIVFVNCLAVTSANAAADILWNRVVDDSMVVLEGDEDVVDSEDEADVESDDGADGDAETGESTTEDQGTDSSGDDTATTEEEDKD